MNNNTNNATANSNKSTADSSRSTPFQSPLQSTQNLQNGYYNMNQPVFASNMFPGPIPMHPMNIYALNPYGVILPTTNGQHNRSSSHPAGPGNASNTFSPSFSSQSQGPTTVNPQLISSPPLEANWMQQPDGSYFHTPPQNLPVGFGSPYLGGPHNNFTPLFASPDANNYDGLGPNAPAATAASASVGTSQQRGTTVSNSKKNILSDRPGSNDTSLHPSSSSHRDPSKRHSAPIPRAPSSDTSGGFVLMTGGTDSLFNGSSSTKRATDYRQQQQATRSHPPRRSTKRRRLSEEDISGDDDDDDDDDDPRSGPKLHKACANCRKQKGKCVKKETEDKCRMCRTRGLSCTFEPRPERKQPIQRKVLQEQLRKKDAIIESFRQMLQPHMLRHGITASDNAHSSGSPPSSAAHEEPLRRQVLEWLDKAEASRTSNIDFSTTLGGMRDGRVFNDSSSDEAADDDNEEDQSTGTSALSKPGQPTRGVGRSETSMMAAAEKSMGQTRLDATDRTRDSRSRSPRVTRSSTIAVAPVELIARASLRGSNMNGNGGLHDHSRQSASSIGSFGPPGSHGFPSGSPVSQADIGVARHDYFVSGDALEAQRARELGLRRIEIDRGLSEEPKLLRKGLIVPDEVDKLFEIFYEKLNVTVSLLDPVLHTPATTFARCPLLFTVVCAVAARYYTERPELYSIAMHFAMTSAASSLMDSKKSVELCQAYLLLSVWPLPSRKYDEDRAWLYLGLAIRMAMDLNLHLPTNVNVVSEQQEREILNRTRTWMVCFNMDRASSAQLGKPMTIRENYMIRNSADWYTRSKFNLPYDMHLCQLTALMRIMSRFQETVYADVNSPSGVREDLDLRKTAFEFDDEITAWEQEATQLFAAQPEPTDPGSLYRRHLLPFHASYSRLVILSFGFQYSFRKGLLSPNDDLVMRCLDAAQNVISKLIKDMAVRAYLRYTPDSHLVFASFASAFLLKLLRHKFVHLLSAERRSKIIPLVEKLIKVLNDSSVAIDDSHTPKIYARFLAGLLHKHRAIENTQRMEQAQSKDMEMNGNGQANGLSIDLSNIQQHTNAAGPLSPPSPHPSIRVTPPPVDEQSFGYMLHNSHDAHLSMHAQNHLDTEMLGQGSDVRFDISGASGSGTVHPMDQLARGEEEEDIPACLGAIHDSFWQNNAGMVTWLDVNLPSGWDKEFQ